MREEQEIAERVIQRFEDIHGEGESRGACQTIAFMIKRLIPNSIVVAGYVRMPQGRAQHYWVELEDGTTIDPLAEMWMDAPFTHEKLMCAISEGDATGA